MGVGSRNLLEKINSAADMSKKIWWRNSAAAPNTRCNNKTPGRCYCVASSHEAWWVRQPSNIGCQHSSYLQPPQRLTSPTLPLMSSQPDGDACRLMSSVSLEYVFPGWVCFYPGSSSRSSILPSTAETSIVATVNVKAGQPGNGGMWSHSGLVPSAQWEKWT